MREDDWKEVLENKIEFVEMLKETLQIDEKSQLDNIVYEVSLETRDEYLTLVFAGGTSKTINITFNSNYANAKAILEAVYE